MTQSHRNQPRGFSLIGTLIFTLLLVGAAIAGLKLGPHYLRFWTVYSIMEDVSRDPSTATMGGQALIQSILKKLYINDVRTISGDNFVLEKAEIGRRLAVHYQVREHLFGNLDAVLTFDHFSLIP